MKFILLLEIPAKITVKKRVIINQEIGRISYEKPKRNTFLIEMDKVERMEKIKAWIIKNSSNDAKVFYYQILEK
jgi:hypothetical protein